MSTIKDVKGWVRRDLLRFVGKDHVEVVEDSSGVDGKEKIYRFRIYTDVNNYCIVVKERPNDGASYMGCVSSSRKFRAGEDWTRGNDLSDGSLSEKTWRRILADIVSYEMVRVHTPKPNTKMIRAESTKDK